jgi:putative phosphoesterase
MSDLVVGVISDTHALIRPAALTALAGSDLIVHAGDIGSPQVIARLCEVAPTFVVRGNNDTGRWAARLPDTAVVAAGDVRFYVLHVLRELDVDPVAAGFAAVVSGHSHRSAIAWRDGVLYLNPGSAGPRRFRLPVCVARVRVTGRTLEAEVIELEV